MAQSVFVLTNFSFFDRVVLIADSRIAPEYWRSNSLMNAFSTSFPRFVPTLPYLFSIKDSVNLLCEKNVIILPLE